MGSAVYLVPDVVDIGAVEIERWTSTRASAGAHEPRRAVYAGEKRTRTGDAPEGCCCCAWWCRWPVSVRNVGTYYTTTRDNVVRKGWRRTSGFGVFTSYQQGKAIRRQGLR